jgi:hypothetical protein
MPMVATAPAGAVAATDTTSLPQPNRRHITMPGILTMEDARALAAILRAADRKEPVASLDTDGRLVRGCARYIGKADRQAADPAADVRELNLFVLIRTSTGERVTPWLISRLIRQHQAGTFVTGQQAVLALPPHLRPDQIVDLYAGLGHISAARSWIADSFGDVDVAGLADAQVYEGIEQHYEGGWTAFIRDGGLGS